LKNNLILVDIKNGFLRKAMIAHNRLSSVSLGGARCLHYTVKVQSRHVLLW